MFFGSAATGAGVEALLGALPHLLPASSGAADGEVSGAVFEVERGLAGDGIALVRMFSGTLSVRDRLALRRGEEKVTAIRVFVRGGIVWTASVSAGQMARGWGLRRARSGDPIGVATSVLDPHPFTPPMLETIVVPASVSETAEVHQALQQLAEQDPLINVRQRDDRQEVALSLDGEVQKEVLEATLAADYGLEVTFRQTTTICVERPTAVGAAAELIGRQPNPFLATVGLRVAAGPDRVREHFRSRRGARFDAAGFRHRGRGDRDRHAAVSTAGRSKTVGLTMTHAGYYPRQSHAHARFDKSMSSTAGDFGHLTRLVLMEALRRAGSTGLRTAAALRAGSSSRHTGSDSPCRSRAARCPPLTSAVGGALRGER